MPLVNVMVNGRAYTIACDEGEEDHLRQLAEHVDSRVRELLESVGQAGDLRLVLMAALLITDDYFDAVARLDARNKEVGDRAGSNTEIEEKLGRAEEIAAETLEAAARRIEDIAGRLAQA